MAKIKKYVKNLFQSETLKNCAVLLSGNVLGQAVSLLAYPILTRLYSQEEFGIFALFSSVTGLLAILTTCKYEEGLLITKNTKETDNLLGFSLKILIIFFVVSLLFLAILKNQIFSFFHSESIAPYWLYIPFTVFFTGLFYILTSLANRNKQYKIIASSGLSFNISSTISKIILALLGWGKIGLITGNLIGQIIACFSFSKQRKTIKKVLRKDFSTQKATGIAYKSFPLYNTPRSLINFLSGNLPFLLLTGIFGNAQLGLFSLAFTAISRPLTLISGSLYNVFFEKASNLKRKNEPILPFLKKYHHKLFLFGLPLFILMFIVATPTFKFVFGNGWEESGTYFQYILPWMFVLLVYSPISFIPILFDKQHINLYIEILYLLLRCIALYIGIFYNNFHLSIILFSIAGCCGILIRFIWSLFLVIKYERSHD